MNKGKKEDTADGGEAVCMIRRTPLLCIMVFAGVSPQSHTIELLDWLL